MNRLAQNKITPSRFKQKLWSLPIWGWVGGGVFLVLWLVLVILFFAGSLYQGTHVNHYIEGLTLFSNPGQEHRQDDIMYDRDVPVGGAHHAVWLNCGIYDEPVQEENIVHSLEHGAIWLAYQPELPAGQVELLRDLVRQEHQYFGKPFLILAPKPNLDVPVIVTAWQMQLKLDNTSDKRLVQFLRRYRNGLFAPEPKADCTGGVGRPID
ncbi:MAG: DUF3105 domain-containing protein [Anaerolineae bacterium]|nr:DUF3105 domain-containing protein [Anaerolineae bacterium]